MLRYFLYLFYRQAYYVANHKVTTPYRELRVRSITLLKDEDFHKSCYVTLNFILC